MNSTQATEKDNGNLTHAKAIEDARAQLRARAGVAQRHKGAMRTAPRAAIGQARNDCDKIKAALKKFNMQSIGPVDEVILHCNEGDKALIFKNPRVTLSPHNNTTAITGNYTEGEASTMDNILSKIREMAGPTGALAPAVAADQEDSVPTLVEDFEAFAEKQAAKIEEVD